MAGPQAGLASCFNAGRLAWSHLGRWGAAAATTPQFAGAGLFAGENDSTKDKDQQQGPAGLAGVNTVANASILRSPMSTSLLRHGPLLPGRRSGSSLAHLTKQGLLAGGPSCGPVLARRGFVSWSPAQRYFVEGDHVVSAEANRHFQFTGLDAGSFYPFVIYTAFATAVATVFMVLPLLVAPARVDLDKSSAYECGFDAFGEARQTFSVSFYLVSIMYLLFDIEIAYLFPYVMTHANSSMFWTMNLFLGILVVGFIYEWGVGALEWRDSDAK